ANPKGAPQLSAFGGLLGLSFVLFTILDPSHAHAHADHYEPLAHFFENFLFLARESAPALLMAYTAAGLIHALLPKGTVDWLARGSHTRQALKGMVFAIPLPICSCGILPLYQSLVNKGVPTAAAVTLLLATPELGIDAIFLSFQLVDTPFAIARIITASVLALTVGLLAVRFFPPLTQKQVLTEDSAESRSLPDRLKEGLRVGLGDLVDNTAPWIVAGLAFAAALKPLVEDGKFFASIPGALEVPAFALLGLPIYVCASGATPLAAVLIFGGASPGAAIAFLLTGPATNATTFGILGSPHGKKAAILFAIAVAIGAIGCGYIVNFLIPEVTPNVSDPHALHDHGSEPPTPWSQAFLYLVVLLFGASIFRKGPRSFISQIFALPADDSTTVDPNRAAGDSCCTTDPSPPDPAPGKT
ncbi:MAG: permease, partial [Planctomycetota bacterium]